MATIKSHDIKTVVISFSTDFNSLVFTMNGKDTEVACDDGNALGYAIDFIKDKVITEQALQTEMIANKPENVVVVDFYNKRVVG